MGVGLVVIVFLLYLLGTRDSTPPPAVPTAERPKSPAPPVPTAPEPRKKKPAEPETPKVLSAKEIAARAAPSVALLEGKNGSGTAFLIDRQVLATNRHVIDEELPRHLHARFPDADRSLRGIYGVNLLYVDPDLDLAFLTVDIELPPLEVARDHRFVRGQEITVIGSPGLGDGQILQNAISRGLLSTETTIEGHSYYQIDASINPGNSGGPVFDEQGHVIGVVTLKAWGKEGLGFCLPIGGVLESLERARNVSVAETQALRARHRMRVVSYAVLRCSRAYAIAGRVYVRAMESAMEEGVDLNVGLRAAQAAMRSYLLRLDGGLLPDMNEEAEKIPKDRALEGPARERFEALWRVYVGLKDHIDSPHGTFDTYKLGCTTYEKDLDQVAHAFRVHEGVDVWLEEPEDALGGE
jgi:S1-C subfamily serine protease